MSLRTAYYDASGNNDDYVDCSYVAEPPKDKLCRFKIDLKHCDKGNYGYDTNMPCIYLKLNKAIISRITMVFELR